MKKQTGFTFIELMIVFAIIGIFTAIITGIAEKHNQSTEVVEKTVIHNKIDNTQPTEEIQKKIINDTPKAPSSTWSGL